MSVLLARAALVVGVVLATGACSRPPEPRTIPGSPSIFPPMQRPAFLGLRTVVYPVTDLERAKSWYSSALRTQPYFDEPFYVGFNVGGFELGLQSAPTARSTAQGGGGIAYWGVENADAALARLLELGATQREAVRDVGGGVRVASVRDPFGNIFGIVENPQFRAGPAR